jgi:hypothetical protein
MQKEFPELFESGNINLNYHHWSKIMLDETAERNKNTRNITESMNVHLAWYDEAKGMTLEELPSFLDRLQNFYTHDYGTICHAIAASAIATAWAMNKGPQGGITGFQAGAVMWEFIRHWGNLRGPITMMTYEDMLYPQFEHKYKTISQNTFDWMQEQAKNLLAEDAHASREVRKHWQSIVNGVVPFGYTIED